MANLNTPSGSIGTSKKTALAVVVADTSIVMPANSVIDYVLVKNNTANAITGGLKFGTTAGATDIVVAVAVGGNALLFITDALLLKRIFSTTATQQIFIDAVAAWNSASVDITIIYKQL